jgi:hypothetical protein
MAARVTAAVQRGLQIIIVIDVARCAGHVGVAIGQRKPSRAVIETCCRPTDCVMAYRTIRRRKLRSRRRVNRIIRLLPSDYVAAGVGAIILVDLQAEVASHMTLLARHGMTIGQRKTDRRLIMLNRLRTEPGVETLMASLALVRWETRRGLGMRGSCRVLPILHVARITICRKSQEISDGSALVALVTLHHSVRAKQRESVEVLLDRLIGDIPTGDGVALGAIGPHLTAMNVGVAVRAILPDIRKDRFDVALRAGNFFVHATKRISRGVVAEFRNGAYRNPA